MAKHRDELDDHQVMVVKQNKLHFVITIATLVVTALLFWRVLQLEKKINTISMQQKENLLKSNIQAQKNMDNRIRQLELQLRTASQTQISALNQITTILNHIPQMKSLGPSVEDTQEKLEGKSNEKETEGSKSCNKIFDAINTASEEISKAASKLKNSKIYSSTTNYVNKGVDKTVDYLFDSYDKIKESEVVNRASDFISDKSQKASQYISNSINLEEYQKQVSDSLGKVSDSLGKLFTAQQNEGL